MLDHVTRPIHTGSAWLTRSIAIAALTVLTIASVLVAVALEPGLPSEVTSRDVPDLGAPEGVTDLPVSAASSAVPPAQPPNVRGMAPSAPASVAIPALEIQSPLVGLGLEADTGALQVPSEYDLAGWYADGPYPGQANGPPAVIVGHVDSLTGPAVFFRLREIQPGTEIQVTRTDGSTAVFHVVDAHQYPKAALPDAQVYARRQPAELVLITCSGEFDDRTGSYLENFVVTARLDPEASGVRT